MIARKDEILSWWSSHTEAHFFSTNLPSVLLELARLDGSFSHCLRRYEDEVLFHIQGRCLCCDLVSAGVATRKVPCFATPYGPLHLDDLMMAVTKDEVERRFGPSCFCKAYLGCDVDCWSTEMDVYEACKAAGGELAPELLEGGSLSFSLMKDGAVLTTEVVYYLAMDRCDFDLCEVIGKTRGAIPGVSEELKVNVLRDFPEAFPEIRESLGALPRAA